VHGCLLDMDGVLYQAGSAIPGAVGAVEWLRSKQVPHLFLTNTTSRPRSALVEKLAGFGLAVDADRILTPPVAAVDWLASHTDGPAALFVPEATADEFARLERLPPEAESGAASVVIGDLGEGWDFTTLNRAFRLLMTTPPPVLVALGLTRYWRAPDGLRLDVGAFVAALERASGLEAVVLGKPARPFFDAAVSLLGSPPEQVLMIGDDIVGDVRGAQDAGLRAALVRTGKFREQDLHGSTRPDQVLDSIADLPRLWSQLMAGPDRA
jgi:HAD superfamily hydrolase (TIGR01458 family)